MRGPDDTPEGADSTPSLIAYRELAYEHSARLVGYLYLLTGDGPQAEGFATEAFRRVWEMFRRGDILGDAEEHLYRQGTRAALQWMQRTGNLRGYQPPTTSRDQDIVAMGVVSGFQPQQRAGVLLVVWAGLDERLAGVASGLGEARVKDLVFAARQEFREAAKSEEFEETLRGFRISAHSETVLDEALDAPSVSARRARGWIPRLRRIAAGPAALVITLVVLVVVFRDCGGTSIKTGAGRTSDVAFARAGNSIVVVETGTGREIGRVPAGALSSDGEDVYSARPGCRGQSGATTISRSDPAVIKTSDLGCVDGTVSPVAVDEANNAIYATAAGSPTTLRVLSIEPLTLGASLQPPDEAPGMFDAPRVVMAADRSALLAAGESSGSSSRSVVLVGIEVPSLRIAGSVRFPMEDPSALELVPISSGRVLAYDASTGRLRELDPARGQLLSATDLPGHTLPRSASGSPGHTVALSPDELTLYMAVPDGGIVKLDVPHGQVVGRMNPDQKYLGIGLSTDGAMIYAIEVGGAYVVVDATNGNVLLRRPNTGLTDLFQVNRGQ